MGRCVDDGMGVERRYRLNHWLEGDVFLVCTAVI